MTEAEIHAGLRRSVVDRIFDYDVGEVDGRVDRLSEKLKGRFDQIRFERPHDECGYYSFDIRLYGAPDRFRPFRSGVLTQAGGQLTKFAEAITISSTRTGCRKTRARTSRR